MAGQTGSTIRTKRRLTGLPPALRPVWPYAKRFHTLAVRCCAPLVQRVSWARRGALPYRTVNSADEAVLRGEAELTTVYEPFWLRRPVPEGCPRSHPSFVAQTEELVPRVMLAEIPGGRVLGRHRAVITGAGTLVGELSPYFGIRGPEEHPVFADLRTPPVVEVAGRVGVLAARGDVSYYHYLIDVLPRLAVLESLVDPPQQLYIPASLPFQSQLIRMLGLAPESILDSNQLLHVRAQMLVVPGLPDVDLKTPPWLVAFLRRRLRPAAAELQPGLRLYVTRGASRGSRIVLNEPEVAAALTPLGFTVLDPGALPVADQIGLFSRAELIVAPHGAALANLAFCSSGASVIELFAPDFVQGCYWKLSQCVEGVRYSYVVGGGRRPRHGRMEGVDSDMTVDVGKLRALLANVLSARGEASGGAHA